MDGAFFRGKGKGALVLLCASLLRLPCLIVGIAGHVFHLPLLDSGRPPWLNNAVGGSVFPLRLVRSLLV